MLKATCARAFSFQERDWSGRSCVTLSRPQTSACHLTAPQPRSELDGAALTSHLPPPTSGPGERSSDTRGSHDFSGLQFVRGGQYPGARDGEHRGAEDARPGGWSAASVQRGGAHVRMEDGGCPPRVRRLQSWLRGRVRSGGRLALSASGHARPSRREPEERGAFVPGEVRGGRRVRGLGHQERLSNTAS